MPRQGASLQTIADEVGVTATTVHRTLSGTGPVSEETRRRIEEAATRQGYRPNLLARSLRTQRSMTIGVVVTSLYGPLAARQVSLIDDALGERSYGMVLGDSRAIAERERQVIDLLLERGVDGLLIFPGDPTANGEYLSGLLNEGIAIVLMDHEVPGCLAPIVAADHDLAGYMVGRHLVETGRSRVVFVTPPHQGERTWSATQSKLAGCNRALAEASQAPATILESAEGAMSHHYAMRLVKEHLASGESVDAVFCAHDLLAAGAMRAVQEAGLRVPEDVAVVGYGDEAFSGSLWPSLTTVRHEEEVIAERAVSLVLHCAEGSSVQECRDGRVYAEPELVVRESSAGPRIKLPERSRE